MVDKKCANRICAIKKKYKFRDGFDLHQKLNELPTAIFLHQQLIKTAPRLSELKANVEVMIGVASELREVLRNTPASTKIFLNKVPEELIGKGCKNICQRNPNWLVSRFETDLSIFYDICLYAQQLINKDKGGRKADSIPKYVIFKIAAIYHLGTGNLPTCGWKEENGRHVGKFYQFVLEVPTLKEMKIALGTKKSIGTQAIQAIRHYKKVLKEKAAYD